MDYFTYLYGIYWDDSPFTNFPNVAGFMKGNQWLSQAPQ